MVLDVELNVCACELHVCVCVNFMCRCLIYGQVLDVELNVLHIQVLHICSVLSTGG
jgi:hypothetical protein